ncbi:MAG: hypothetical protein HC811_08435 [Flammeovirgaceae bacterium]|nr:hypothetical protein [Flammeovirgaceae bacterium]
MNTFKKIVIVSGLVIFSIPAFSQSKQATAPTDCFKDWYTIFRERGAKPVTDGTHDAILSFRKEGYSQCFMAKVDVKDGKIVMPLKIAREDGTYETGAFLHKSLDPVFAASLPPDELLKITDGMSITFYTTDKESGKLFFYKFVNDKPKALKIAPSASDLIKN